MDGETVLDRRELVVGEATGDGAELSPSLALQTVEGLTVTPDGLEAVEAGKEVTFTFTATQDGQPVDDLQPYLGAAAHVAIVSEDGERFDHTHGEAIAAAAGADVRGGTDSHDMPGEVGSTVEVTHTFEEPGLYKIWVQVNRGDTVVTTPFVVEVV